MTQLTEHAKTILRAIADGKTAQMNNDNTWVDLSLEGALRHLLAGHYHLLRVKPETRSINGQEFAAPVWDGSYHFSVGVKAFAWNTSRDRDTAYAAIVSALTGETK